MEMCIILYSGHWCGGDILQRDFDERWGQIADLVALSCCPGLQTWDVPLTKGKETNVKHSAETMCNCKAGVKGSTPQTEGSPAARRSAARRSESSVVSDLQNSGVAFRRSSGTSRATPTMYHTHCQLHVQIQCQPPVLV
uniref:Uncharacterized protein n=1 Tax=Eutreptiella gymnastica TaxID=73025 RepID=A0A7S4GDA2_9EUGL